MSERDDILNQLKEDLEDKLHSSNPDGNYTSDIAEVKRGIHYHGDVVNRPFIGFALDGDELSEEVFTSTDTISSGPGNDQWRTLVVRLYGYVNVSLTDYEELHTLIRDVEYFLKYDFTYNNYTTIGSVRVIEGGVNYPVSYFDVDLQIQYMNDL